MNSDTAQEITKRLPKGMKVLTVTPSGVMFLTFDGCKRRSVMVEERVGYTRVYHRFEGKIIDERTAYNLNGIIKWIKMYQSDIY